MKNSLWIILIILVIAIFAGFFIWNNYKQNNKIVETQGDVNTPLETTGTDNSGEMPTACNEAVECGDFYDCIDSKCVKIADETILSSEAENVFQSLDNNNYNSFIKDFSDTYGLKTKYSQTEFDNLRQSFIKAGIGKYISKESFSNSLTEKDIIIIFNVQYENEEVRATIGYDKSNQKINYLSFSSTRLSIYK